MADRFPLILNTSTNQIQEIPNGDQLDLSGNNVANAGIITATTFSGNLTGNVTGNINGNLTGTLQTGAQPNITSLGTLSSLNVSGNASIGGVLTYEDVTNVDSVGIITARDDIKITTDNKSIIMGAGADLSMKHDGTNSYILNNTGSFIISADTVQFNNRANTETKAKLINNGAVELYFDNSKKLQTYNAGTEVIGNLWLQTGGIFVKDNVKLNIGTNVDLEIYHDGSNSYIDDTGTGDLNISGSIVRLQDSNRLTYCRGVQGGAFELYHNNNLRLETQSGGCQVTGDLIVQSSFPTLTLQDVDHNPDWTFYNGNGVFRINQSTNNINFLSIDTTAYWDCDVRIPHDDHKIKLGASDDLEIYHDNNSKFRGTSGYTQVSATSGSLYLDGNSIFLRSGAGNENYIKCIDDGTVELYYDNSKKFETLTDGIKVSSDSNATLELQGTSGGTSTAFAKFKGYRIVGDVGRLGELQFINQRDNDIQAQIEVFADGDTNAYFDFIASTNNNRTFRVYPSSIAFPDNNKIICGNSSDLQIHHDGNHSIIEETGTGNLFLKTTGSEIAFLGDGGSDYMVRGRQNAAVELYYNASKKFETTNTGASVTGNFLATGNLNVNDNGNINVGNSGDLQLFHNGTNSFIDSDTGNLVISSVADLRFNSADFKFMNTADNEFLARFIQNGPVELYHDNSKKIETTSSGAKITGDLTLNHSSNSTDVTGYAVQRIWAPTISPGNVYKCGQWYEGEGAIQLFISVRSVTGGHSGSSTYLFQGGFAAVSGIQRLLPLASGRGHGDNADTGMNSNAWEVLIHNINNYTYALYIHVPSGRTGKTLQVSVTEMNRGNTFTDLSSTVAYSSISVNSGQLTSLQTSHAQVVRQHDLPAFKVGRGNSDQNVNSGDAIHFNITSGSSRYFNQGNHYNTSTGYFTAPYAGVYHFYALIIFEQVSENKDMTDSWDFYLNNTQLAYTARRSKYRGDYTGTSGYFTDPATVTIYMNVGDYVWCRNKHNSMIIHSNPTYSYFCGHYCG